MVHATSSTQGPVYELFDADDDEGWDLEEDAHEADDAIPAVFARYSVDEAAEVLYNPPVVTTSEELRRNQHYAEVMDVLRQAFNMNSFRKHQLEAIIATLEGRDVVVLMPTGGGKSLCYQLPALCERGKTRGVTIVITPLLALMIDQVLALQARGIRAMMLNGEQTPDEQETAFSLLRGPARDKPQMFYLTPERISAGRMLPTLRELYRTEQLARFVVDEAHLIYTWGRDFRCSFTQLSMLRQTFPKVPIMAVTATAPPVILHDIVSTLGLRDCLRLEQSYNRANLYYSVLAKPRNIAEEIEKTIKENYGGQTGIIYCIGKDKCEVVAKQLRDKGMSARHFHADLQPADKKSTLEAWMNDECRIIVATIAFGMGIDKPDVRFVIHHDVPASMTGYIQETGRAGRDGKRSDCILFKKPGDCSFHIRRIKENPDLSDDERQRQIDEVNDIVEFINDDTTCRRTQLLRRFGQTFNPEKCGGTCDNCQRGDGASIDLDTTAEARSLALLAQSAWEKDPNQRIARGHWISAFLGKKVRDVVDRGLHTLPGFGNGKSLGQKIAQYVFDRLVSIDVLDSY
ncbi:ATP-dependent DNA helicase, partial [Vararia minispora EC-137]